jgi:phospholipase/carboxylesterase
MALQKIHPKKIVTSGPDLSKASKVLIMVHGRGGSADDILSLANFLNVKDYALLAPEASGNSWYPYAFIAPPEQNEPWLTAALSLLSNVVNDVRQEMIPDENIYFLGFSQGACLLLEFLARNATRFGGIAAFSGGLIGDRVYAENYHGDFKKMPIFIGSSDPDPHIPVKRVDASKKIFEEMNANVAVEIYPGMGHTISQAEIDQANKFIFNKNFSNT